MYIYIFITQVMKKWKPRQGSGSYRPALQCRGPGSITDWSTPHFMGQCHWYRISSEYVWFPLSALSRNCSRLIFNRMLILQEGQMNPYPLTKPLTLCGVWSPRKAEFITSKGSSPLEAACHRRWRCSATHTINTLLQKSGIIGFNSTSPVALRSEL
jgi:hypothetical protein